MQKPVLLSQRDSRWKDIQLGSSPVTIGTHGCTITAIAMKFGVTPDVLNDRMKAVDGYLDGNLVIWKKLEDAMPGVKFNWKHGKYDNEVVKQNVPCLVEVSGAAIGGTRHWVLFVGNQKMYDPWDGKEKPSNSYGMPLSFVVLEGTFMHQNLDAPSGCLVPNTPEWKKKYEELVTKATRYDEMVAAGFESAQQLEALIQEKESTIRNMNKGAINLTGDELTAFIQELGGIIRATTLIQDWAVRWKDILAQDGIAPVKADAVKVKATKTKDVSESDTGISWLSKLFDLVSSQKEVKKA